MQSDENGFLLRVGLGFDFHRFSSRGEIVLGGHVIPGCPALKGHSDADVLIHACMDAVLGAAGDVDIGTLFPNTDPAYLGACSMDLAGQVKDRIEERGFEIVNMDAVLVCDRPKIAAHREKIRASLAKAFGLDPSRINLKGKTNEGQAGRGPGVEAMVVVLLRKKVP